MIPELEELLGKLLKRDREEESNSESPHKKQNKIEEKEEFELFEENLFELENYDFEDNLIFQYNESEIPKVIFQKNQEEPILDSPQNIYEQPVIRKQEKLTPELLQKKRVTDLRIILENYCFQNKTHFHWTYLQKKNDLIQVVLDPTNPKYKLPKNNKEKK